LSNIQKINQKGNFYRLESGSIQLGHGAPETERAGNLAKIASMQEYLPQKSHEASPGALVRRCLPWIGQGDVQARGTAAA
jgi:hypothetical protein